MMNLTLPSRRQVVRFSKLDLVIGIPFILVVSWFVRSDSNAPQVEQFLKSNTELQEQLGSIEDIKIIKITTLLRDSGIGNAKEPDRKIYRLVVKGEKTNANVRVLLHFTDTDEVGDIEIERIDL